MVHFLIFMDKFYCWNPCLLLIRCFLWLFKKRNKGKLGVSLVPASVQNKMVFVAKSGNFDYPAFETSNSSRNSFMLHQVTSTSIRRRKIAVILFLNGLHFVPCRFGHLSNKIFNLINNKRIYCLNLMSLFIVQFVIWLNNTGSLLFLIIIFLITHLGLFQEIHLILLYIKLIRL